MSEEMRSSDMSSDKAVDSITSDAVIKYDSLSSNRSKFSLLSEQTNLKTPPDNWLCGRFGDHNWSYPLQNQNSSMLSSFRMANTFPECVATVDVIADSESIKKLLQMPFDSTLISLMVHRIGNTLLIDEFDLASHLIHNEAKQWSWLKRFIDDMIAPANNKSLIQKKPITRDQLQDKNILCKFLHYSVDRQNSDNTTEDSLQLSPKSRSKIDKECHKSEEKESKEFYFSHYNKESKMSEMVSRKLDQIDGTPDSYHRNVLWTFEDIRMLVASNMPIFGDTNHPAVSLRLHDVNRPINVLTGLDYWLDNLMSSVPEVVMCYHLDGIVEKYELIKTEEIPEMDGKKLFSPKVIRNIAQNILSFLKSNATKAGHTYWLFKGKHDDVVKLYDLTTLCTDYMEDNDSNPFSIAVAMLLYRVAKNMRDANTKCSPKVRAKIHKLLTNCLSLLDPKRHSQVVSSANYLLSDVYVPNDIDPTLLPLNYSQTEEEDEEDFDDFESSDSSDEYNNIPTLEVNKLRFEDYYKKKEKQRKPKQQSSSGFDETDLDWNVRCERALNHIIEGLNCLHDSNLQKSSEEMLYTSVDNTEECQKMANPSEPIPLKYSSLDENNANKSSENHIHGKELTQIKGQSIPDWSTCLSVCLLRKAAQVFCILAELANSKTECLRALKFIRMGIQCYEMAVFYIEKCDQQNHYLKEPIACLLSLCGDIHIKILSSQLTSGSDQDNETADTFCAKMTETLNKICDDSGLDEEFRWAYSPVIDSETSVEQRLKLCYRCYEESLFQLNDTQHKNAKEVATDLHQRIVKRMGYICNELANHYMNESLKHFNQIVNNCQTEQSLDENQVNRLDSLTKKSSAYFEKAVELFRKVNDRENTSLMLSNMGRLMRTSAHIFAPVFRQNNGSKEFSTKEKHFYIKAIECYKSALKELGVGAQKKYPMAWNNVNWELCTTLYTIGCLLQEFAPLSRSAFEAVEQEITKYFTQALDLCQSGQHLDNSRLVLYQYRAATVCHRLGSLYHNSYRNMIEESDRKKKSFNLSDDYYQKSSAIDKQLNDREETLRVTLERIGLHETNLSQLSGFGSKLKALNLILSIITSIDGIDFSDIESEDEKEKIEKLLVLLETRIIFAIKGLIKCLSSKASKQKDLITKWKQMDETIESIATKKEVSVFERVSRICGHLLSSELCLSLDKNK